MGTTLKEYTNLFKYYYVHYLLNNKKPLLFKHPTYNRIQTTDRPTFTMQIA